MKSSIRVLHLYRKFFPEYTGDGIYYSRLAPLMAVQNTQHIVLTTETKAETSSDIISDMPVFYLSSIYKDGGVFTLQRWLWKNAGSFDILHIHSHVSWRFSAYLICRLMGKSVIFSCSLDDSPGDLIKSYKASTRKIAELLMHSIQVFVAISPRLYLMSLKAVSKKRVINIPQGVQDNYINSPLREIRAQVRLQWNLKESDILLLNVGSICDRKNTVFLIEMLYRIKNENVKLIIVGPELEADYSRMIDELIDNYKLTKRVIKVGFTSQPDIYYKASDILVFSSKSEGFSNVYLEAMCHALPVVTLYLPGLVDHLFDYGRTGFFSRDLNAFVEHIEILTNDLKLRQQMGQAGRTYVLSKYGLEYVASLYVHLYEQLHDDSSDERRDQSKITLSIISDCSMLADGPETIELININISKDIFPILNIVIDTEAEFDWSKGTSSDSGLVTAITELPKIINLLGERSALPCLVVDYPVASKSKSMEIIANLSKQGVELGIHLQPWTTPPFAEPIDARHSFCGNLGPMFEKTKLLKHKEAVEALTGSRVRTFKAGRYGASASTYKVLAAVGIDIDLSISPGFDFSKEEGPDWRRFGSNPGWVGGVGGILTLPTTSGFDGAGWRLAGHPPSSAPLLAALKSGHLVRAQRLSPEGASIQDLRRITTALFSGGLRVFTLSFHSPSLKPGCTPYTKTDEEVAEFIKTITTYVDFFKTEFGGRVMLPSEIRSAIEAGQLSEPLVPTKIYSDVTRN